MLAAEKRELLLREHPYYEEQPVIIQHPKKQNKAWVRRMISFSILACFIVTIGVGYAAKASQVAENNYKLSELQKELGRIQSENSRLKVDIIEAQSLERINMLAQQKLHMKQPEPQQINYVKEEKNKIVYSF